ncbi:hypothetical protein M1271_01495 [Patescibacteria group bacterium]|nr:hypothetical protein [Patescibacteria group bacterium]MCL5798096.1 hypothetical protein [Patescibacteria group bacterium]
MNTTPANSQQKNYSQSVKSNSGIKSDKGVKNQTVSVSIGKEHEAIKIASSETPQMISKEVEIPKEVSEVGVTAIKESIELPPDVKKLGVTQSGASIPLVASVTPLPNVVLPISDQQVVAGLHSQISSALRWMAVWCVKKLKKAHVMLKVIHGKIIRVKSD